MNRLTNHRTRCNHENGFSLVEVMVSMTLVLMALILLAKTIMYTSHVNRKDAVRLEMIQTLESSRNSLLSKSFLADELKAGNSSREEGQYKISTEITDINLTLKKIRLAVRHRELNRQIYFYKSKFIKEVIKND